MSLKIKGVSKLPGPLYERIYKVTSKMEPDEVDVNKVYIITLPSEGKEDGLEFIFYKPGQPHRVIIDEIRSDSLGADFVDEWYTFHTKPKKVQPKSRSQEWMEAASTAASAVTALQDMQQVDDNFDDKDLPTAEFDRAVWETLCSEGAAAMEVLVDFQQNDYQDWYDNLPENLQGNSPVSDKLEDVTQMDLESGKDQFDEASMVGDEDIMDFDFGEAQNAADEAEGADLPMGFGRD